MSEGEAQQVLYCVHCLDKVLDGWPTVSLINCCGLCLLACGYSTGESGADCRHMLFLF
jgi:hypothetical protein